MYEYLCIKIHVILIHIYIHFIDVIILQAFFFDIFTICFSFLIIFLTYIFKFVNIEMLCKCTFLLDEYVVSEY